MHSRCELNILHMYSHFYATTNNGRATKRRKKENILHVFNTNILICRPRTNKCSNTSKTREPIKVKFSPDMTNKLQQLLCS